MSHSSSRNWTAIYAAMYVLYIVAGMGLRVTGWMHDDALVYTQSARRVVDGSFDLYGILRNPNIAPPLGVAYAYSSFMTILIAPFVGVADALGLGTTWAMRLIAIPLLVGDVLAMQQLRYLARRMRPGVEERYLFVGIALSLFVTSFWLVTAYKSHIEGIVLLFLLLTLRFLPRNLLLAGLCAGLALSAKHMTSLLSLIPVALVLLFRPAREQNAEETLPGRLADTAKWGATAAGVFAAFLLPPVMRNPEAAYYALVTQASRIVYVGPGLPRWLIEWFSGNLPLESYYLGRGLVLQYSNAVLVVIVGLVAALVIWRARAKGAPIGTDDSRLLGMVAFGGVAYILLAKWVSDSYFQLPLALVFLWDVVRRSEAGAGKSNRLLGSFPWIGIGAAVAYRVINLLDPGAFTNMAQALAPWYMDAMLFVLFAGVAVAILRDVTRTTPEGV